MKHLVSLALAVSANITSAPCQDLLHKGERQQRPVLIRNAVIHTMEGSVVVGGSIWFSDGVIRGISPADTEPDVPPEPTPRIIDGRGLHVYPGLIAAKSELGLQEVEMVRQTVDLDEVGDVSPEVLAAVAVNPDSTAIPVARSNGVLAACVFPRGGMIAGRASLMAMDGWTNDDMTLVREAGLVVNWPAAAERRRWRGRSGATDRSDPVETARRRRQEIDAEFTRAKSWLAASSADPTTPPDLRCAAMANALNGTSHVFLMVDDLEQIESAVEWALGRRLRPVVVGGAQADLCARMLAELKVPVVLSGVHRLPRRDDSPYDDAFTLPARLRDAGVRFCIATGESFAHERNLPYHAATAAAFGLTREEAVAAITRDAADILGFGNRMGTLTPGKDATLLVTDGSPLDLTTGIEHAFVRGAEVDLRNKQTELARKYRAKYEQLRRAK
jgi:imidazolonepropionase-like amidohydrolase